MRGVTPREIIGHLRAVPDDEPANDPADALPDAITDTALIFTGALAKLGFHPKTSQIQVTLTIDDQSPITNLDLTRLRFRMLTVTVEPKTSRGVASNPAMDPVNAAMLSDRLDRAMASWVAKTDVAWDGDVLLDEWEDG
jgi:hypothetical protein